MQTLRKYGNFTSPQELLGQETKTLAPFVREPKNIFYETDHYVGNVLFSGRFELSIGACLVDLHHLLRKLENENAFGEPLQNAVIDRKSVV